MNKVLLAVLAALFCGNAHAATYNLNRTVGAGTVIGLIETDGTIGFLSDTNIVSWEFTLAAPNLKNGPTDMISSATGGELFISADIFSATATNLFFNFDEPSFAGVFFRGGPIGTNFWCLAGGASCSSGPTSSESIGVLSGTPDGFATEAQNVARSGNLAVATVVPLPASLPFLAAGLAVLGMFGLRRRSRAV
ncbi:MAG: VPLPA-CTERM sorting domain-containing protein [Pseudomonadota bacterium]